MASSVGLRMSALWARECRIEVLTNNDPHRFKHSRPRDVAAFRDGGIDADARFVPWNLSMKHCWSVIFCDELEM